MGMIDFFSSCSCIGFFSSCSCSEKVVYRDKPMPNPVPTRFTIKRIIQVGGMVVAELNYPDCINFEGNKILVYENCSVNEICSANSLDPHFCNNRHLSPVARFEPTSRGWDWALAFTKQCH